MMTIVMPAASNGAVADADTTVSSASTSSQRKHGRLVAHILAAFAADPDAALTVADIAMPAYGVELRQVTKAQRVAVLRAMRRAVELEPRFGLMNGEGSQGQLVVHDRTRVMSYALARLKADWCHRYQWTPAYPDAWTDTEEQLRARLAPGGREHERVVPGGCWWRRCLVPQAEIAGDRETAARLREKDERELAAFVSATETMLSGVFGSRRPSAPAPVKPDRLDPAWDDDVGWETLWGQAKGPRQRRDVLARRVRAAGGKVRRWSLDLPQELPAGRSARIIERWAARAGFGTRVFYDVKLTTVSSGYERYAEETPAASAAA